MFNNTPPPSTIFNPCKSGSEITCSLEQDVRSIADQSIRIPSLSYLGPRFSSTRLSNQQSKLVDRSLLNRSCYPPFRLCLFWYHLASCNLSFANSKCPCTFPIQSCLSTVILEIVAFTECWSSYAMLISPLLSDCTLPTINKCFIPQLSHISDVRYGRSVARSHVWLFHFLYPR